MTLIEIPIKLEEIDIAAETAAEQSGTEYERPVKTGFYYLNPDSISGFISSEEDQEFTVELVSGRLIVPDLNCEEFLEVLKNYNIDVKDHA